MIAALIAFGPAHPLIASALAALSSAIIQECIANSKLTSNSLGQLLVALAQKWLKKKQPPQP